MADNKIKKTSLQEAKANYEEIQAFAQDAIKKEMEEKVEGKVSELMEKALVKEGVTITTDETTVEIDDDGTVSINSNGAIETDDLASEEDMPMDEPIEVSADEDPIEVSADEEEELEEILHNENTMQEEYMEEQEPIAPAPEPAPAAEEIPAEMPVEPAAEEEIPVIDDESAEMGDPIMQIAAGIEAMIDQKLSGEASGEMPTEEMPAEPVAEMPAEPVAAPEAPAPIAEMDEDIMEIVDEDFGFEDNEFEIFDDEEEGDMYEVMIPEMDDAEFDARNDMGSEANYLDMELADDGVYDSFEDEDSLEEMRGLGSFVKRTGNRTKKMKDMPANRAPVTALSENVKKEITKAADKAANTIKAQYESKMGELKKENASLTKNNKSLNETVENYEESFIDIRKQFDLMETFNAKLAFANQLYANGGFSKEERMSIAESFDAVKSYDEAQNLYNNILKENKVSIKKSTNSKIKQAPTNTVHSTKTAEPLYESVEMKRMMDLAGVGKKLI